VPKKGNEPVRWPGPAPCSAPDGAMALRLLPDRHDTDGFFVAVLERAKAGSE
jgi:16S rRNA C967 or C1407 C5-methylase (RsmB/RsmF family)